MDCHHEKEVYNLDTKLEETTDQKKVKKADKIKEILAREGRSVNPSKIHEELESQGINVSLNYISNIKAKQYPSVDGDKVSKFLLEGGGHAIFVFLETMKTSDFKKTLVCADKLIRVAGSVDNVLLAYERVRKLMR